MFYRKAVLFESGKCGNERKKLQKFEYLENEKSFLHEIKRIFRSFTRAIIWGKKKKTKTKKQKKPTQALR